MTSRGNANAGRAPFIAVAILIGWAAVVAVSEETVTSLTSWRMVAATETGGATGGQISTPGFDDSGWYDVTVPCTVLGGLLQNGVYEDPFYGINLQSISSEPFNSTTWWYRTEFSTTSDLAGEQLTVLFKGINYRANVWVNGIQIGKEEDIVGTFRWFSFDITSYALVPGTNSLAVEIYKPEDVSIGSSTSTDLAISFVDWSPEPPDGNMGLWQEVVFQKKSGPVAIAYPQVSAELGYGTNNTVTSASVTILLELHNYGPVAKSGTVFASIPQSGTVSQTVSVSAYSDLQVIFTPDLFPTLVISNPELWWPWQMGAQTLQTLTASFVIGAQVSDSLTTQFGLRQVTSELIDGNRLFTVNGKPILIRGGGFTPDLFQRVNSARQETEMTYLRDMYMNTIRLEGKMENDHFFDLADQYGMLVMPGWCCCDAWQHWDLWGDEEHFVAQESTRSQVRRLRIHPSIFVFLYGSDQSPPLSVEEEFLAVFDEEMWVLPTLASAADTTSIVTGRTGVKMTGPYSWVPPNYWLTDDGKYGGAWGFFTEGGPGEAPLTYESLARTLPEEHQWPIDSWWDYHTSTGTIGDLSDFTPPLNARYGTTKNAVDYSYTSQVANYEGLRALFEGYSRNKYTATGVIQWMQNNPWISFKWHFYDYFLVQGGGYFGSKKSCEPLHIMYAYDDNSIYVVNSLYTAYTDVLQASVQVILLNGTVSYSTSVTVPSVEADSAIKIFSNVPSVPSGVTGVYFLRLMLKKSAEVVSDNLYWLSTQQDILAWKLTMWYRTPCSQWADFTNLRTLPVINLKVTTTTQVSDDKALTTVTVANPTSYVAFFVRAILQCSGVDVVPVLWSDNYVTLMPNEAQTLTASCLSSQLSACQNTPTISTESFNNNAR
ncbi:glycosyl hydrolase family 2 [Pelomyxa schiedti]|nr:glycosyl hydrolase family 2 [Pelomyxa schiedti]